MLTLEELLAQNEDISAKVQPQKEPAPEGLSLADLEEGLPVPKGDEPKVNPPEGANVDIHVAIEDVAKPDTGKRKPRPATTSKVKVNEEPKTVEEESVATPRNSFEARVTNASVSGHMIISTIESKDVHVPVGARVRIEVLP